MGSRGSQLTFCIKDRTVKYAMGFGWGVCLRGAGTTNYLVRAVRIDDEEWGMCRDEF